MTAKQYLNQAYDINKGINKKIDKINMIKCKLEKSTQTISDMPMGGNYDNKMENYIGDIVDIETDIDNDIDRLTTVRRELAELFMQIDNENHRTLLTMRYLDFKPWGVIAEVLHKHHCTVRGKMHGKALKDVCKIIW